MKQVNVGVIGFGTVGAGTVEALLENREIIRNRVGADIVVRRIADLDAETDRGVSLAPGVLTRDAMEVIDDPEIHIVAELMGGTGKAKEYILRAMDKGKHVVTANKALLAEYGKEIYEAARLNEVDLAFEGSVGGGIPIIGSLRGGLSANRIGTIVGILNGTSNYILTRMSEEGMPYDQAVQEAISLGYAEDPPTLDVDGTDAAHKLAILISICFGVPAAFGRIHREGIDRLTPEDVGFAKEFGYSVKLLAVARRHGERVEARVHPTMIPGDHILANVNGPYNAVYLEGDFVGPNLYYGLGAGRHPTGSAVASDIIYLAREIRQGMKNFIPPLAHARPREEEIDILPIEDLTSAYYFRFSALDRPGVLSKISGILGENDISLSSVIQKGRRASGSVPVVMLTHEAEEGNVIRALAELDKLPVLTSPTVMVRVEEAGREGGLK
ncbi:MAG: homoserine dehydrogenase [Desulfobacteraceae bacterium]